MIVPATAAFYLAALCASPGPQPSNSPDGAVPIVTFTFENDQDRDFDQQPDDWTRRKGRQFPAYVHSGIDREFGRGGRQSLRFDVNGGLATTYSPPIPIDALHSYVFDGYIRTQGLEHDAAIVSLSLLNHKRERLQRFLSVAVSGTHSEWVPVRIGPVVPDPEVRFAVLGCHLIHDNKMDIRGTVWFDDLVLGMLPQLSLAGSFHRRFMPSNSQIEIHANVSGLDLDRHHRLRLELVDGSETVIDSLVFDVEQDSTSASATAESGEPSDAEGGGPPARKPVVWSLPPQSNGYYEVTAFLEREGSEIVRKHTSFAVLDLVTGPSPELGEFGWTIENDLSTSSSDELAEIAAQAGINWLKYPLWSSIDRDDQGAKANQVVELLEALAARKIKPVGLLNDPPPRMRGMFAQNWRGCSEIFAMPPEFWSPSLDPVIARYWSHVRHWQLGGDADTSFVGLNHLSETLRAVKHNLDRIGRDTRVGVHWDWNTEIPSYSGMNQAFLSMSHDPPLQVGALKKALKQSEGQGWSRWALIKPLPPGEKSAVERGADMVRRMVTARHAGAEAVFAWNIYDPEYGLLHPDGAPTPLFLPWRTAALALRGAEPLGSIEMPNRSHNCAFVRDGEVTLIVWNEEPTQETLYLGENLMSTDLWGRHNEIDPPDALGRQTISVGPVPQIIEHCSEPVARWRSAMRFENGRIKSEHGEHAEAILGRNTFPQGVSGTVTIGVPDEWDIRPGTWPIQAAPGEEFRLPMVLTLPQNASLGPQTMMMELDIEADRRYKFRVDREFVVGLGDVLVEVFDRKLEDGRLEVEQVITNNIPEGDVLDFRCDLRIPGMRPLKQFVTRLKSGKDHKFYYLPDAQALKGTRASIRAKQEGGRRILNYEWEIGKDWE